MSWRPCRAGRSVATMVLLAVLAAVPAVHAQGTKPAPCVCPMIYAPVCGSDGKTYGNACEAKCAGVKKYREGPCNCICPALYALVCGFDGKTYSNECEAKCANTGVATQGPCPTPKPKPTPSCFCPEIYRPVCAVKKGVKKTYGNGCHASCDGATVVSQGKCGGGVSATVSTSTASASASGGRKLLADCICTREFQPVCGTAPDSGMRVTYGNACEAACGKAKDVKGGTCPEAGPTLPPSAASCSCIAIHKPVCDPTTGITYPNGCEAACSGAAATIPGACTVCKLPPNTGACRALFKNWYYEPSLKRCKQFTYGGCKGNGNNFVSKAKCEAACKK